MLKSLVFVWSPVSAGDSGTLDSQAGQVYLRCPENETGVRWKKQVWDSRLDAWLG